MHRRLPRLLLSLLFIGLWGAACGGGDDPEPTNTPPTLSAPTAQATEVNSGAAVVLNVTATDPDGDTLTYAWTQTPASPAGTFNNPSSPNPTWTAPEVTTATSFQLSVTVSDGKDGTRQGAVAVMVRPAPSGNQAPVLGAGQPTAAPTSVVGAAPVQLSVTATDANGDALTYAWTQTPASPAGSFNNASISNPVWTAPLVTAAQRFTLQVTVSDGRGGSVQGTVNVDVAPPVANNRAPTVTSTTATPSSVTSQQTTSLAVTATDPDGDTLTYTWAQSPATPAGTFSSTSVARPTWTAPTVTAAQRFTLTVTVSDGKGGSAQGTVNVDVAPQTSANRSPTLTSTTANPSSVTSQQPTNLSAVATDPDGDTLVYTWTQSPTTPAGTFNSASVANPTWTAPAVTAAQRFTLRVTVSDGRGGTAQGTVNVDVTPPVANNNPPTLTNPTATPSPVGSLQPTSLAVTATDPDGDPLTYTWSQLPATPVGTFSSTSVANPTWTAPKVATDTSFQLFVSVSDGRGGAATKSVALRVLAFVNTPPTVTGPSASPSTINEQTATNLSVSATDPDGDNITYSWAQLTPSSPLGTFSSTSSTNPTWTAPNVTANGVFRLRVTVSDGQGGIVRRDVDVTVNKVNQPPNVNANIAGPTTLAAGDTGAFSITASDPDGDPLTYSWSQTAPATLGTFVGSQTSAAAQWFSPVIGTQTSFTLSVSVTDGQSPPITRNITVPVTVPLYATSVQSIWNFKCTGCHGGSGGLSLGSGTSYSNLVNVLAGACSPQIPRVAPGNPDGSALIRKMEGTGCGTRMPSNDLNYFTNNPGLVVRVRSWILGGAPNN